MYGLMHRQLGKLAEALAPSQGTELIRLARLEPPVLHLRTPIETAEREIVENIKKLYFFYIENKMPFLQQVQLLSLLPKSWSYEEVMEVFSCSRHAIRLARQLQMDNERLLASDKEPAIRQRADPNKIRHFVSWLVESNTLISGMCKKKDFSLCVYRM